MTDWWQERVEEVARRVLEQVDAAATTEADGITLDLDDAAILATFAVDTTRGRRKPDPPPERSTLPYPWCCQPEICQHKGYCPRDPNCGE